MNHNIHISFQYVFFNLSLQNNRNINFPLCLEFFFTTQKFKMQWHKRHHRHNWYINLINKHIIRVILILQPNITVPTNFRLTCWIQNQKLGVPNWASFIRYCLSDLELSLQRSFLIETPTDFNKGTWQAIFSISVLDYVKSRSCINSQSPIEF